MSTRVTGRRHGWVWKLPFRILFGLALFIATAWWTLALFYAGPGPSWIRTTLALVFAASTLVMFLRLRPIRRALRVWCALFLVLLLWWINLPPSNDRDWAPEVARLPSVDIAGERLTFHDIRNFDYRSETDFTERYETRTVDLSRLVGLDLFMSYWGSPLIAHTIMSWQFEGAAPIAISIETRKRRGQEYSSVQGFFKQYELIYVVADERDVVRLRTNYRGEQVYLYRFNTPVPEVKALLLDYVGSINGLQRQPEFYNALTDNCTTSIRRHVTHVDRDAPPFDWRLIVNGYGDRMLYERGRVDTSLPFPELRAASLINSKAKSADHDPNFSELIRAGLPDPRRYSR